MSDANLAEVISLLRAQGADADLVGAAQVVLSHAGKAEEESRAAPAALFQKAAAILMAALEKPPAARAKAVRSALRLIVAAADGEHESAPADGEVGADGAPARRVSRAPSGRPRQSSKAPSGAPRASSVPAPAAPSPQAAFTFTSGESPRADAPPPAPPPPAPPPPAPPTFAASPAAPPVEMLMVGAPPAAPKHAVLDATPVKIWADAELLGEFVADCRENISRAEQALLDLDAGAAGDDPIGTTFRAFHTVKGSASMLGLDPLTKLAHAAESLMARVRDGSDSFTRRHSALALKSIDRIKDVVDLVERAGPDGDLIAPREVLEHIVALDYAVDHPESLRTGGDEVAKPRAGDEAPTEEVAASPGAKAEVVDAFIRVRLDRLDALIDLVGETVIAHSMVSEASTGITTDPRDVIGKTARLGRLVRDLQSLSLSLRMVPLKPTFGKLARAAHDAAQRTKKDIDFEPRGEETEIDRNMVALVADPLIHMLRNAIDHGIEPADKRIAAGKPARGRVSLSAYHAAGSVVIELGDDGQGLDRDRILEKAIEQGLVAREAQLTDSEIFNLIFEAGFSTKDEVSEVSGRGVGMDVVRRSVDELHGHIDIKSVRGQGTTFSLRFPLTLAITDGLVVSVGADRFIVPIANVEVSLRPQPKMLVNPAGQGELLLLRNGPTPLVRLHQIFDIYGASEDPSQALVIVVRDGNGAYALLVDEVVGQQQVVAKALGPQSRSPAVSAGAILGDGRVGLILDVAGLAAYGRGGLKSGSIATAA